MDIIGDFYRNLPEWRCSKCGFAKAVTANGGTIFLRCYHAPYKGKWVAEIKDCPKNR